MIFARIVHGFRIKFVRSLHHFNLVDETISRKAIGHLCAPNSTIIIPYSDYPGIFIKALLGAHYERLILCEKDHTIRSQLERYVREHHPDRNVNIFEHDILGKLYEVESDDSQAALRKLFSSCHVETDWKKLASNRILVPLLKKKSEAFMFRSVYNQIAHRNGLLMNGRMEFYMLLSGRQSMHILAKPSENLVFYRSSSVLYNTVFDIEVLLSMNLREAFNIHLKRIQPTPLHSSHPRLDLYNQVHLVRMTPKADLFDKFSPYALLEYRFLVQQCMHARTVKVISFMERWFQNCGEDLSRMGFDNSKRFGDMTRGDIFRLYKYISSRPDYKASTLQAAASDVDRSMEIFDEALLINC